MSSLRAVEVNIRQAHGSVVYTVSIRPCRVQHRQIVREAMSVFAAALCDRLEEKRNAAYSPGGLHAKGRRFPNRSGTR